MKFLKAAIIPSDFSFYTYEATPVKNTIKNKTIAKYRLEGSPGDRPKTIKHSIPDPHNRRANTVVNSWKSLTNQGTASFSDSSFFPNSRIFYSEA